MKLIYFIALIIYTVVLSYPLWRQKKIDFFSPMSLWSILTILYSVPFLFIAFTSRKISDDNVLNLVGSKYDKELCLFIFNQCLFAVIYFFSYKNIKIHKWANNNIWSLSLSKRRSLYISVILYAIAILMSVLFIINFGGISVLIASFTNRDAIVEGNQIYLSISNFFVFLGAIFHLKYLSYCKKKALGIIICLAIGFVVLSLYGGRSPFLTYLITVGVCYNYLIQRINIFSLKLLSVYLFAAIFFILILGLRLSSDTNISELIRENALSVFGGNSYVDIQVGIRHYFSNNDFWLGKTFSDFHEAFIPRSLLPSKRPVDDGVYYYFALNGYSNVFNTNSFPNSWPPSTLGSMYANFGYFGIIIGAYILAYIHKFFYSKFITNSKNVLFAYIYSFVAIKFQLTFFYIANICYAIIYVTAFVLIFKVFFPKINKSQ